MKWSLKLGKLLGIDVYLHFTFLLLLGFLGFIYWRATQNVEAALQGVAFIVALFGCVVLHEMGHALMAHRRPADARKHQRDDHGQCRDGPECTTKREGELQPKCNADNGYPALI